MGYILLGLGVLDVDTSITPYDMEFVAIPAGTTIRFFAVSAERLSLTGRGLDLSESLQAPWPALDCTRLTYNLCLFGAPGFADLAVEAGSTREHTILRAAEGGLPNPIRMCSGTPTSCPTRPRQVSSGAAHTCDGILSRYAGDLYWLACSSAPRGKARPEKRTSPARRGGERRARADSGTVD